MKKIIKHLKILTNIKRKKYHPLIHKIHKEHKISKKTLFYIKEYGPHSNVPKTIIRESIKIIILASLISLFGGFAIEKIRGIFISIIPFVIMLPALNGLIGGFGAIVSSKVSTRLHEGSLRRSWWKQESIIKLYYQILIIGFIISVVVSLLSLGISSFYNGVIVRNVAVKVFFISIVDVLMLVSITFLLAVISGLYVYKKKEDPNNFLIPISTSVADFANMILLALLIVLFF